VLRTGLRPNRVRDALLRNGIVLARLPSILAGDILAERRGGTRVVESCHWLTLCSAEGLRFDRREVFPKKRNP
jgi:hypothetical protein